MLGKEALAEIFWQKEQNKTGQKQKIKWSGFCPKTSGKVSLLTGRMEGDESGADGAMTRSPQGGPCEKKINKKKWGKLKTW